MNNQSKYKYEDFENLKLIGKGNFSEVFVGEHKRIKGFKVAIKVCVFNQSERIRTCLERELLALTSLNHPNINECYGYEVQENTRKLFIFLQFCNGGDLLQALNSFQDTSFPEYLCQYFIKQIVFGVQHIHNNYFCHRDIKPANFLLHYDNEEDRIKNNLLKAQVKISDFGFSRYLGPTEETKSTLGTPFYADPKIFLGNQAQSYGNYVDIWSIGVLSYQLLTGMLPFIAENLNGLGKRIHEDGSFTIYSDKTISEEFLSFLNCTLQKDSNYRWDINDLARHHFIVKPVEQFKPLLDRRKGFDGDVNCNVNTLISSLIDKNIWLDDSLPRQKPNVQVQSSIILPDFKTPIIQNNSVSIPQNNIMTQTIENKLKLKFEEMNAEFFCLKPIIAPFNPYETQEVLDLQLDVKMLNN